MTSLRALFLSATLATGLGAGVVACGGDDSPPGRPTCDEITEACHPVDPGSGPIHDCHENSETGTTEAQCQVLKATCIPLCYAAQDGGPIGTDAGSSDATSR